MTRFGYTWCERTDVTESTEHQPTPTIDDDDPDDVPPADG